MSDPPATKACVDLLSQLQVEMNRLSELLFGTIGELQRDAGPVSVNEEEIISGPSTYDAEERGKGFAGELLGVHRTVAELIAKLPTSPGPQAEQLMRIAELQRLDAELQGQVEKEHEAAEEKLRQVHALYAVLAQEKIRQRAVVALARVAEAKVET